ncbi:hypothetical protein [Desulfovibrio sp. ZJ369]|uniref:hypothetical protein n=1 Tax=Desulfovibrio sp. ZJ369 TaxID=2709793 RepID=UPI0013EBBFB9|nr:hypothetical protein [Desulfovibrio sp. ZJ369]
MVNLPFFCPLAGTICLCEHLGGGFPSRADYIKAPPALQVYSCKNFYSLGGQKWLKIDFSYKITILNFFGTEKIFFCEAIKAAAGFPPGGGNRAQGRAARRFKFFRVPRAFAAPDAGQASPAASCPSK